MGKATTGAVGVTTSGLNYLLSVLDPGSTNNHTPGYGDRETVSPYAGRSDPEGLCGAPSPFAGSVSYPVVRGYQYEGY